MGHDPKLVKDEDRIEQIRRDLPDWIKRLERPPTPTLIPKFGPLEGIRVIDMCVVWAGPFGSAIGLTLALVTSVSWSFAVLLARRHGIAV